MNRKTDIYFNKWGWHFPQVGPQLINDSMALYVSHACCQFNVSRLRPHHEATFCVHFLCRSRPLPVGFIVPPAECQGRRLPGVARLAWSRPRPLRAQRGGEGVCACSGNSNIQRHRGPLGSPRAPKAGWERGLLLPQSSASEGLERASHPV